MLRATGCVELPVGITVTVKGTLWPCDTTRLVGDAEIEKSNALATIAVNMVECVIPSVPVPDIVMG